MASPLVVRGRFAFLVGRRQTEGCLPAEIGVGCLNVAVGGKGLLDGLQKLAGCPGHAVVSLGVLHGAERNKPSARKVEREVAEAKNRGKTAVCV